MDIKKQQSAAPFAFLQFSDIESVVKAMRAMDGELLGGCVVSTGPGSAATRCHSDVVSCLGWTYELWYMDSGCVLFFFSFATEIFGPLRFPDFVFGLLPDLGV